MCQFFVRARYSLSHDHMDATDIHINFWNHMKFSHLKIMQVLFFFFIHVNFMSNSCDTIAILHL